MVKKYEKFVVMGISIVFLSTLSFLFGFWGKNKSGYTTILPNVPVAHADVPAGNLSGDSGSDSGGSGGSGDCSGGSGAGAGSGSDDGGGSW